MTIYRVTGTSANGVREYDTDIDAGSEAEAASLFLDAVRADVRNREGRRNPVLGIPFLVRPSTVAVRVSPLESASALLNR